MLNKINKEGIQRKVRSARKKNISNLISGNFSNNKSKKLKRAIRFGKKHRIHREPTGITCEQC